MPAAECADNDKLQQALMARFGMTEEVFPEKFRGSTLLNEETCSQFVALLRNYLDRWVELAEAEKPYEALFELFLREQFLSVGAPSLELFLKERKDAGLADLVARVEEYVEAHDRAILRDAPHQTTRPLWTRLEPSGRRAVPQRLSRARVLRWKAAQKPTAPLKKSASACVEDGFDELKNRGEPPILSAGFIEETLAENRGLPVVEGFAGNRKVGVVRDTGCNTVIGNGCLVSEKNLTEAKSPVYLLDHSVLKLPEASIVVDTPYFSGRLKAKCIENLLYVLVLENVEGARPVNCPDPYWRKEAKLQASAPGNELERHHEKQAKGPLSQERGTAYMLESGDPMANHVVTRAQTRGATQLRKLKVTGYFPEVSRSELVQEQKGDPTLRICHNHVGRVVNSRGARAISFLSTTNT
ncbi:hypothetical protein HPB48_002314 [Haemaphysalis longicornis]|uniref:SCAN box domain-containing protein n=1 Tax=Haemaphysalis longicornis TaxID=44386 RepID=A0A9J6FXZ0_HAELO|nr:hypothetical protein HPB48_002314 [Haemaphysalis longicornis]